MATITTTIPFRIRTKAGAKSFAVGANPADEHDIAHPFVGRLLDAGLLTIEVDEADVSTGDETPVEQPAAKTTRAKAKG